MANRVRTLGDAVLQLESRFSQGLERDVERFPRWSLEDMRAASIVCVALRQVWLGVSDMGTLGKPPAGEVEERTGARRVG